LALAAALPACAAGPGATLEVVSDEGWCIIYVDGDRAAEIPLSGHKATVRNVTPGEHFVRITDAFDEEWYDGVVDFPEGGTLRAKAEPSGFTIINKPEPPEEVPPEETPPPEGELTSGLTKIKTGYTSFYEVRALVYVNSDVAGETVTVDGDAMGVTPLILKKLKPGKHVIKVGDRAEVEVDAKVTGLTEIEVTTKR
jgi:hypothetical protein